MNHPTGKLLPSAAPQQEQLAVSMAVLADASAPAELRAHAKCWSIYRAIEGMQGLDDAIKIEVPLADIKDPTERVRWGTSLAAAEFYMSILNGGEPQYPWSEIEEGGTLKQWLQQHRGFIVNWMRVRCVMAYEAMLLGEDDNCKRWVKDTLDYSLRHAANTPFEINPLRVMEMRSDWHAWALLVLIGQRHGFIAPCHAPWATAATMLRDDGHMPYMKCMLTLEARHDSDKRLFTKRKPGQTMKTRNQLAQEKFHGVGVELGVAKGEFSNTILQQKGVSLLYSIDQWSDHHNVAEYFAALTLLKTHGIRSMVVRAYFADTLHCIPNERMDFVYIDGYAHTGQEKGKTLDDWWPKLKSGGIFSGHDYDPAWPLTVAAVDAFVAKHGLTLNVTTDDQYQSWWCVKP